MLFEGFKYVSAEGGEYWVQTMEQLEQMSSSYYWLGFIVGIVAAMAAMFVLVVVSNLVMEYRGRKQNTNVVDVTWRELNETEIEETRRSA